MLLYRFVMLTFKILFFLRCLCYLADLSECQLCTGLEKCCFGYMWDGSLQQCLKCGLGYYGKNCSSRCIYPNFGEDCQNDCNCSEDACDFAFGCRRLTGSTQLELESHTIQITSKSRNVAGESTYLQFDFKYLFLVSIIALSCVVLLNVLCFIAFKRRYVKRTTGDENYEDLGDTAVNMYSSLSTGGSSTLCEAKTIGQIRMLNSNEDKKYILEFKTKPFKLNLNNCTCTLNIRDPTNETNASDSLTTEGRRSALSPGNLENNLYIQVS